MEAWHFIKDDYRMQYSDELVEVGKTYTFNDEPILCRQGYHASLRAINALSYSPGPIICRVKMSGDIVTGDDKLVATERQVIWMADASETLREFARWCALEVAHLWNMPDGVRQYLETGEESLRAAARDAAWDAARAAAWDAAWAAARAAARDAAWAAARAAAMDAAWAAAMDAAWAAARDAARAAAWAAAMAAAWDAARTAEKDKQNNKLESMLLKLGEKQ